MKILYISQYFPPEMGAPSARVFELARQWVKLSAEVTVLTTFPNHPTGVIPDAYKGYIFKEEEKEGIRVLRTYIFAAPNKGFFRRIFSYWSFMISSIIQGTGKVGDQDIIVATSPQFFVGIAGYIISRLKKVPFVFEVRDLWPESIVQLGQLKNRFIIHLLERIEMALYNKSVHVVGVADSTIDVLTSRGLPINKISIIKNGVDLNLFKCSGDQEKLKQSMGYGDKFIVSYIGTHGLSHALDKVLDTADLLRGNHKIIFLLVGEGAEKAKLKKKAASLSLNNVVFQDQINKDDLPTYYYISDLVLVTLRDLPLFRKVIPSKLFEIMAMSRPIIISVDGEARTIVEKANAGVFSVPENPKDLKENIELLYTHASLRSQLGRNGRIFVEENFDRNKLATKYLELIKGLIKE